MENIKYGAAFMGGLAHVQEFIKPEYMHKTIPSIEVVDQTEKLTLHYLPNYYLQIALDPPISYCSDRQHAHGHLLVKIDASDILWSLQLLRHGELYKATKQILDNQDSLINRIKGIQYTISHAEFAAAAREYIEEKCVIHPQLLVMSQYQQFLPLVGGTA